MLMHLQWGEHWSTRRWSRHATSATIFWIWSGKSRLERYQLART